MKRSISQIVFVLWLILTCAGFSARAASVEHVIIISLDGGRTDVILSSDTPNIREMADGGAWTWWAQTVNPSITLPSHASMLTGALPQKHGLTWNDWEPEKGLVRVPTCFAVAKAAGLKTAMFVGKEKFKHLATPGTLDRFEIIAGEPVVLSEAAARYFQESKPNLMFVHYALPDVVGHAVGWGTREQRGAFAQCDKGIGILRAAVKEAGADKTTLFIITADHGGHERTHGTTEPIDMTIPWIAYGPGLVRSVEIHQPVNTCDTAATAIYALGLKPQPDWNGKAVTSIFAAKPVKPAN